MPISDSIHSTRNVPTWRVRCGATIAEVVVSELHQPRGARLTHVGARLLNALDAGAPKSPRTPADALARFDVGYLVETYRQLGHRGVTVHAAIDGMDGYAMVRAAMAQVARNITTHFAS